MSTRTGADEKYRVRTVRGIRAFRPEDGVVLPHEHIIVDSRVWWEGGGDWHDFDDQEVVEATDSARLHSHPQATLRENLLLSDWYLSARELRLAREAGTQLVVDVTVLGSGPNAEIARRAADLAGIELVVSVGRYLDPALPEGEHEVAEDRLVERWLSQIEHGYEGGILPGIIGEIGTSWDITEVEACSLRAAGRVQATTGLPMNIHVHPFAKRAMQAIDIAEASGADPSRIAISHLDCEIDVGQLKTIMARGAYVELDNFGTGRSRFVNGDAYPDDSERLDLIDRLLQAGFADRLLLSHDINHRNSLVTNGGWGYRHIARTVRNALAERFGDATALQLTSRNPLTLLDVGA